MFNRFKLATFVGVAVLFAVDVAYGQETSAEHTLPAANWTQDAADNSNAYSLRNADELWNLRWVAGNEPGSIQAIAEKPSPYLIGVHCEAAGETEFMSKEVGGLITVQGGLKINQISEDSPAEKIGMQVDDIILIVDGKTVANINDLVSIINEKGEKEIHGLLIRDQNTVEFDVTPAKRPEEKEEEEANPNQFTVNRNLYWYVPNQAALPEGYLATIDLESGSKPTITIKKGDKIWKTTDVSKLPKETKPFVGAVNKALLPLVNKKQGWVDRSFNFDNYFKFANQQQRYLTAVVAKRSADDEKDVARKLDELQKQIGELTRIVGELKQDHD